MKILEFKNGNKIKIADEQANVIGQRIVSSDGAKLWQIFHDTNKSITFLIINLNEVAGIYDGENVL